MTNNRRRQPELPSSLADATRSWSTAPLPAPRRTCRTLRRERAASRGLRVARSAV